MLSYEEERRKYSYASKPNIRKYDHTFNGRICLKVYSKKPFRDCKSYLVEDKLGDIVIALYESADVIRQEREAKEEAERQRQEKARRKEERRNRYNLEVQYTNALLNQANDYEISCKIRTYIAAVEASGHSDEKTTLWLEWAKQKADWYDPTIARKDELLGVWKHKEESRSK